MVKFTHILYPTDLSAASQPAFAYAAAIARWYDAELTVLHVAPSFEAIQVAPPAIGEPERFVYPPSPDAVRAEMRRTLDLSHADGINMKIVVEEGDPGSRIVDLALEKKANLIVMGTHGRRGFDRVLHGSVTERTVQSAPCPVLTIPPHAAPAPGAPIFRKILCPVDFSPSSQLAFGFALDLASQSKGAVTLLNVVELGDPGPEAIAKFNLPELHSFLLEDATTRLKALASSTPHPWCEVTPVAVQGRSHHDVLRQAGEVDADLIVIGAQGHHGLGLTLFGSTTHQVVRGATCPVLVVRQPEG